MEDDDEEDDVPDWVHVHEVGAFEDEWMEEAEENAAEEHPMNKVRSCLMPREIMKLQRSQRSREDVGGSPKVDVLGMQKGSQEVA